MNDEDFSPLERALRRHSPGPLPDALQQDLERTARGTGLTERMSLADRIFALWTTTGALAAAFAVAFTVWQLTTAPKPTPASPQVMALQQQQQAEFERLLASR